MANQADVKRARQIGYVDGLIAALRFLEFDSQELRKLDDLIRREADEIGYEVAL